jgi:hypothetical protein
MCDATWGFNQHFAREDDSGGVRLPHDELALGLHHDVLLVKDVILLPRLHDVLLLQLFQRVCLGAIVFHLDLNITHPQVNPTNTWNVFSNTITKKWARGRNA